MTGWSSRLALGTVPLIGDAQVLASSLCIAGYYVFGMEIAVRLGVPVIAAWTSIVGAVVLLAPMDWELT
jgi:hypothetical protein